MIGFSFVAKALCAQVIVDVEIDGVRNSKGVIRLAVYTESSQYPHKPICTHIIKKDSLQDQKIKTQILTFKPGTYVFSLLDDENNNDALDYNRLRIPREGYGFSNNIVPFLKAPPFKKCIVILKSGRNKLNIKLRYKL